MSCRKQGTLPEPRLRKRGLLRLRGNGRKFVLGQPGSRQTDERYKAILVAWGAGGGRLPGDFKLETETKKQGSLKRTIHNLETTLPCVADLLCTAILEVEEKCWRWYLLRRSAVALEPYANLPAVEFGPRLPGKVAKTMANTPM